MCRPTVDRKTVADAEQYSAGLVKKRKGVEISDSLDDFYFSHSNEVKGFGG